jgi:hypothetical protein
MVIKALSVLFISAVSLVAQTTTITINDNNGNQAVATVTDGHLYFRDNSGNIAIGTLQGGNVFLNTSQGETIFGRVKDGNVTLTDQKGTTTGTIRNGNIFLSNSDGTVTTGTYNRFGTIFTNTTPAPANTAEQDNAQLQRQIQQNNANAYAAGYAMGSALGNGIALAIDRHRMKSFCKSNPSGIFIRQSNAFSGSLCQNAPFTESQQKQVDGFCNDHPGGETGYGLHTVTCFIPPVGPNLKWAKWEMGELHKDYEVQVSLGENSTGANESRADWTSWKMTYCRLAPKGAPYRALDGTKQHCD